MKANSLTYGESSLVDYINGEFAMELVLFLSTSAKLESIKEKLAFLASASAQFGYENESKMCS